MLIVNSSARMGGLQEGRGLLQDAVLLQLVAKELRGDAEHVGGAGLHAVGARHRFMQHLLLELHEFVLQVRAGIERARAVADLEASQAFVGLVAKDQSDLTLVAHFLFHYRRNVGCESLKKGPNIGRFGQG